MQRLSLRVLVGLVLLLAPLHASALIFSSGTTTPGIARGVIENPAPLTTATTFNNVTVTPPASTATLTLGSGKTVTVSNTLTFTGTDASSVAFGTGGTVAYVANKLSVFAATTSAELAGVLSNETGTGLVVFNNTPTFVTPVLGAATATSIVFDAGVSDSGPTLALRGKANALEFGYPGIAGYGSTLGMTNGNGHPYLCFNCEASAFNNQFRTRGIAGVILKSNVAGALQIGAAVTASADQQDPTIYLTVSAAGAVTITDLATTGAATGKTIVCADTNGKLYRSTSGVACAN